jgi:hypothetical protein
MARKKKSFLGSLIGCVVFIALIVVCTLYITSTRVFGSYKSEAAGKLFGQNFSLGSVTYTFSGLNKVEIQTEVTILGSSTSTQVGKYSIKDNEITFTFTEEKKNDEGKTEKVDKSYTYSFYKGKGTIKIDNTEYKKVK